jgi:hypothetical protein
LGWFQTQDFRHEGVPRVRGRRQGETLPDLLAVLRQQFLDRQLDPPRQPIRERRITRVVQRSVRYARECAQMEARWIEEAGGFLERLATPSRKLERIALE